MSKVADSREMMGLPATPKFSDYQCSHCGQLWRYDRQSQALHDLSANPQPRPQAVPNPKSKPLSLSELNRLRLVFSSLREFHAGYVHIERFAHFDNPTPALLRFFQEAITAKLDGFFQDRTDGLLAVLRLVNCPYVKEIEAALDTPIGSTTFARLERDYRDKNIAHPQFRMDHLREYVERVESNLTTDEAIAAFRHADRERQKCTAAAYVWLELHYPQLCADADDTEDRCG